MIDLTQINLVALVERDTVLKKKAGTNGGEWAGPCPVCGGTDRFRVWPTPASAGNPSFWCRHCEIKGDAIAYLMAVRGSTFKAAVEFLNVKADDYKHSAPRAHRPQPVVNIGEVDLTRPCFETAWQTAADQFINQCFWRLKQWPDGEPGRAYLAGRAITLGAASRAELGYNPVAHSERWGSVDVWLPRGIVIPWEIDSRYWNVRIRRFNEDLKPGQDKYISATGNANGLYGIGAVHPGATVVMVEGEFNAIALRDVMPGLHVVGTGSYSGGRVLRWVTRLALSERVLLAFDPDEAGELAATFWTAALGDKARQLPPVGEDMDINDMVRAGVDVASWIQGEAVPA